EIGDDENVGRSTHGVVYNRHQQRSTGLRTHHLVDMGSGLPGGSGGRPPFGQLLVQIEDLCQVSGFGGANRDPCGSGHARSPPWSWLRSTLPTSRGRVAEGG